MHGSSFHETARAEASRTQQLVEMRFKD